LETRITRRQFVDEKHREVLTNQKKKEKESWQRQINARKIARSLADDEEGRGGKTRVRLSVYDRSLGAAS